MGKSQKKKIGKLEDDIIQLEEEKFTVEAQLSYLRKNPEKYEDKIIEYEDEMERINTDLDKKHQEYDEITSGEFSDPWDIQEDIAELEEKREAEKDKLFVSEFGVGFKDEDIFASKSFKDVYKYVPPPTPPSPPEKPRKIKLLVTDLDDTFWEVNPPIRKEIVFQQDKQFTLFSKGGTLIPADERVPPTRAGRGTGIISSCGLSPYRQIDERTIENDKCTVVLKEGVPELIEELKARGIRLSIASKNDFSPGKHAVEAFGYGDAFDDMQIGWGSKDVMILKTLDKLRNKKVCISDDEVMFLDDGAGNLIDVYQGLGKNPVVLSSVRDYKDAREILRWIE